MPLILIIATAPTTVILIIWTMITRKKNVAFCLELLFFLCCFIVSFIRNIFGGILVRMKNSHRFSGFNGKVCSLWDEKAKRRIEKGEGWMGGRREQIAWLRVFLLMILWHMMNTLFRLKHFNDFTLWWTWHKTTRAFPQPEMPFVCQQIDNKVYELMKYFSNPGTMLFQCFRSIGWWNSFC